MSNRGLTIISVVSGLIAVAVFMMIITAYAGSGGGGGPSAPIVKSSPGQPVDSDFIQTTDGNQAAASPGPTVQAVNPSGGQSQTAPTTAQPVEAPSPSAPQNPFTSGIH
jgi:hypothetical protein